MGYWLKYSAFLHILFLVLAFPNDIKEEKQTVEAKKTTLVVSFVAKTKRGMIKGFPSTPGEQAGAYIPDDSCSWSSKK